jgi:hypothetical protein
MTGNACMSCKHFDSSVHDKDVCTAYPGGIPDEILDGTLDHRSRVVGDRGIIWASKPGLEFMAEKVE